MKKGFTLIELIVAVFIFSVLVTIAGGSFVSALNLQRRALKIKKVEENGRFILELISRELRVANPINTANNNCPVLGGSYINFQHPVNGGIEYYIVNNQFNRAVNGVQSIISNPDVEVTRLIFCISGNSTGDNMQPRVNIILGLKAGGTETDTVTLDLQTTVSQRVLSD